MTTYTYTILLTWFNVGSLDAYIGTHIGTHILTLLYQRS